MVCVMSWACCSPSFCGSAAVEPSSKLVQWLVSAHACLLAQLHVLCAVIWSYRVGVGSIWFQRVVYQQEEQV